MLIKMAFRNVFRNKRRSILTGLMMIAGFWLTSINLSIIEGTFGDIIAIFTEQYSGHAQIVHKDYSDNPSLLKNITHFQIILDNLRAHPMVAYAAPRVISEALVYVENKNMGALVIGIDSDIEAKMTHYDKRISSGTRLSNENVNEVLVGKQLATSLKIQLNSQIVLISQGADGSIANDLFTVVGIIGSEQESKDDYRVYMPLQTAMTFFSLSDRVQEISIHLKNIHQVTEFTKSFKTNDDQLVLRPWQEIEKEIVKALTTKQNGSYFTQAILMLMVGITILNTVLMSILERSREFGVLKALGTRPYHLFAMINLEALFLAILSIIAGACLSVLTNYYLSVYGIKYAEPVKFAGAVFSVVRGRLTLSTIIVPSIIVLVTAFIASLYPAYKASKSTVSKSLREV